MPISDDNKAKVNFPPGCAESYVSVQKIMHNGQIKSVAFKATNDTKGTGFQRRDENIQFAQNNSECVIQQNNSNISDDHYTFLNDLADYNFMEDSKLNDVDELEIYHNKDITYVHKKHLIDFKIHDDKESAFTDLMDLLTSKGADYSSFKDEKSIFTWKEKGNDINVIVHNDGSKTPENGINIIFEEYDGKTYMYAYGFQ